MEAVFDVIQSLQLTLSQLVVVGPIIFLLGYFIGTMRLKKLIRQNHGLEKAVMALNEELLYGTPASDEQTKTVAPVIGLKTKNYKNPQIAK